MSLGGRCHSIPINSIHMWCFALWCHNKKYLSYFFLLIYFWSISHPYLTCYWPLDRWKQTWFSEMKFCYYWYWYWNWNWYIFFIPRNSQDKYSKISSLRMIFFFKILHQHKFHYMLMIWAVMIVCGMSKICFALPVTNTHAVFATPKIKSADCIMTICSMIYYLLPATRKQVNGEHCTCLPNTNNFINNGQIFCFGQELCKHLQIWLQHCLVDHGNGITL